MSQHDDKANTTSNLSADSSNKVQATNPSKKLVSRKVNDIISRGRAMTGSPADQINVNPIQEAEEKTAVMAFGRFNPPTIGHEKLIKKVESVARQHGGSAHVIASHQEGNYKNPVPAAKKTQYLKKVSSEGTHVSHSDKEHPTLLHQAAKLHSAGYQHLVMVAGDDRVKEYHTLLHKYNGQQSKHGHYNFKSIKVVSAGQRDPDAEGAEGMSGTKMREHARSGNMAAFKSGLPKALHPHAEEIADHIRSVKEDIIREALDLLYSDQVNISETAFQSLFRKSVNSEIDLDKIIDNYSSAYVSYLISPKANLTAEQFSFNSVNNFIANYRFSEQYNTPVAKQDFGKTDHFQALDDLNLNTANRNHTIKEYSYGPLNPLEDNKEFWSNKAELWDTSIDEAKKARCGNCAAFNQSESVMKKIADGLGPNGSKVSDLANLGFCEIFEFKCAGDRTCDAWLVGGPLKEEKIKKRRKEFVPSAPSYSWVSEMEKDPKKRLEATTSLTKTYKKDTPGQNMKEDINSLFEQSFKPTDREAVPRSGQDRKKLALVLRPGTDRKNTTDMYRQQSITKTVMGDSSIGEQVDGCPIDEDFDLHELIEENFIPSGKELYEDWGEPLEEAVKSGRKVKLGKPFLTPSGPKKRAVYVKNERGNVVKVNFGDPNMTIKKSDPARRRSFRARHNCDNPGPRTKARYWSCKAW